MKSLRERKILIRIITVALFAAFLIIYAACEEKDTTGLTSSRESITVTVGDALDVSAFVKRDGGGKVYYAVENSDVLSLDGSEIKGLCEGEAVLVVSSGRFTLRIPVTVKDNYTADLAFNDVTATYDGRKYNVAVSGNIPDGTEITYTLNGEPFDGAVNAGVYIVNANVKLPDKYVGSGTMTAVLTINKARYDMSGVTFANRSFTYDGQEKTVTIVGALPAGISVEYKGNRATEAGEYIATATFAGEDANYEKLGALTCKYKIERAIVPLTERGICDLRLEYSAAGYVGGVSDLPVGTSAEYYTYEDNSYKKLPKAPYYEDAGNYCYYVKIIASENAEKNYRFTTENNILTMEKEGDVFASGYIPVTVEIQKARLNAGGLVLFDPSGRRVSEMTYGNALNLGSGAGYVVRVSGEELGGVKNEFVGLTSVTYTINGTTDIGTLLNEYGNLDSDIYHITAVITMPEGYDKNYLAVGPLTCDVPVRRAKYDTSGIEFDTSNIPFGDEEKTWATYRGEEFVFAVKGCDEGIKTEITLRKDGVFTQSVLHAGSYEIKARFTLKKDAKNYAPIDDKIYIFNVKPLNISLPGITLIDKTVTYDGTPKSLTVRGEIADDKINVEYKYGDKETLPVLAGKYTVTAMFSREGYSAEDYSFTFGTGQNVFFGKTLTAVLTVNKAPYTAEDVVGFAPISGLTYRYGMKLSEVGFTNNAGGYVHWKNPNAEIGNMTVVPVPSEKPGEYVPDEMLGAYTATAVYNADPYNREDYEFTARMVLNKGKIDLTGVTVPEQFIAKSGSVYQKPVFVYPGTSYDDEITVSVEFTGDNTATFTVTAEKLGNYYIVGNNVFSGVKIYVYNPMEFEYKAGTKTLSAYRGGATSVTLPEGTEGIKEKAFDSTAGKAAVTSLTLPDGVRLTTNSLYGMNALEKLNVGSLSAVSKFTELFGREKPNDLYLTVRDDDLVNERLFTNCAFLASVKYFTAINAIGSEAFAGCGALREFIFDGSGIASIGENAFYSCSSLEELTLPYFMGSEGQAVRLSYYFGASTTKGLKRVRLTSPTGYALAPYTFDSFTGLTSIEFSDALESIGMSAFRNITLTIDLSAANITEIGDYAFAAYLGTNVTLPEKVVKVGAYAFKNATNLTEITLPEELSEIGGNAFAGCKAKITFTGVKYKTVKKETFRDYEGTEITLPLTVTTLGEGAFYNSNIEKISYLPELTEIGKNCFFGCEKLKEFTAGEKVNTIGTNAFMRCAVSTFTFLGLTPPQTVGINVFEANNWGIMTVVLKIGANEAEYKNFLAVSGLAERYTITYR